MGNVEDVRKLLQDLVAPDLKALSARLDSLEQRVARGFVQSEEVAKARHETVLATIAASNAQVMGALEMEKRLTRLERQAPQIERNA